MCPLPIAEKASFASRARETQNCFKYLKSHNTDSQFLRGVTEIAVFEVNMIFPGKMKIDSQRRYWKG